jgi:hypothetical protein
MRNPRLLRLAVTVTVGTQRGFVGHLISRSRASASRVAVPDARSP